MRQTCDKSSADRVRHNDKHNGNCACDLLEGNSSGWRYRDGDINVTFDKLLCENRIPIELLSRKFVQELDALALDVAEIAKCLDEHGKVLTFLLRAARMP